MSILEVPNDVLAIIFELAAGREGSTALALAMCCKRFLTIVQEREELRLLIASYFTQRVKRRVIVSTGGNRQLRWACRYHRKCCTPSYPDFPNSQCSFCVHFPFMFACAPCMAISLGKSELDYELDGMKCKWKCAVCLSVPCFPLTMMCSMMSFLVLGTIEGVRCCLGGCCLTRCDVPATRVSAQLHPPRDNIGAYERVDAEVCCCVFCCTECLIYARAVHGQDRTVDISTWISKAQQEEFQIVLSPPGRLEMTD